MHSLFQKFPYNLKFSRNIYLGITLSISICFCYVNTLSSQKYNTSNAAEIYNRMDQLGFLGSVLYVAAHPDDENTRLISHFANARKAYTAYVSLTRGDGGQNLIGTEIGPLMGVMRTQELQMARKIDRGHQWFTSANDFGFSKNAEETFTIWDKERIAEDLVWVIRNTRPDVIINRFDHRSSGTTHGHHTAASILSVDVFDKLGDNNYFPEQLKYVSKWQPRRLFFNLSWWFYGSQEAFDKADKSNMVVFDVGDYFPFLGKSNTEIAALSRSMHRCQGFGSIGTRGTQMEYLELLKGDLPKGKNDVFEGINTTWSRVNAPHIQKMITKMMKKYDFKNPSASLDDLVKIYTEILKVKDDFWREQKLKEIQSLITDCAGLYIEARSSEHKHVSGSPLSVECEVITRLAKDIKLVELTGKGFEFDTKLNLTLETNKEYIFKSSTTSDNDLNTTNPYWLNTEQTLGMYEISNMLDIGKPTTDRSMHVMFVLEYKGVRMPFEKELVYRYNKPEVGEIQRPVEIIPAASVKIEQDVYVFSEDGAKSIEVSVTAWKDNLVGKLSLIADDNWDIEPSSIEVQLSKKEQVKSFLFTIKPNKITAEAHVHAQFISEGNTYDRYMYDIDYEHIPYQVVMLPARSRVVKMNIEIKPKKVAYVMGAGDEVPTSLRQIGCVVDVVKAADLNPQMLGNYKALVFGVRAFNTEDALKNKMETVFEFAKNGGVVIAQYNVNSRLQVPQMAPFKIQLSRSRVTVENAPVRFLLPEHKSLNKPNKITLQDFEGWVQERGLYYPSEWGNEFDAVLSSNDPGEAALDSGLLVGAYGDGYFVYTSLAFFRQLPAGVPGAYRLFANLLSLNDAE